MIVIGLDFGLKHLGVSVGDTHSCVANPVGSIYSKSNNFFVKLDVIIRQWCPALIVIGMPLNADGTKQPLSGLVTQFGNQCKERYNLNIEYVDERWTTVEAKAQLFAEGGVKKLDKSLIDAASAQIILQQWFDINSRKS